MLLKKEKHKQMIVWLKKWLKTNKESTFILSYKKIIGA